MVVKIQQAAEETERAVGYNRNKMSGPVGILEGETLEEYEEDPSQTGHVLAYVNVPELSSLENEFSRLKMKNRKNAKGRPLEKPVFHMSVNPGEGDRKLSEREIVEYIGEIMRNLGYKDNPYAIFKHNDIEREHYHVVATRIGQDGKKVNDSFENRRCNDIIESLAVKYGYTVGADDGISLDDEIQSEEENRMEAETRPLTPPSVNLSDEKRKRVEKDKKREKKDYVPPFDTASSTPVSRQYAEEHEDAMLWSFSTPEQYAALMLWRYNTAVNIYDNGIRYCGIARKGETRPSEMTENEIGIDAIRDVLTRCQECTGDGKNAMKYKKAQRERIEKLTSWAADNADSWTSFRKTMEKKGVYVVVSWNEAGEPFGVTYLDRATKCAWKASETDVDLAWLKAKASEKGWEITRHPLFEKAPKRDFKATLTPDEMKAASSRRMASHYVRNSSSPSVLESLANRKGVGKTRRSNVDASKNKDRLKKEGEEEKNEIII